MCYESVKHDKPKQKDCLNLKHKKFKALNSLEFNLKINLYLYATSLNISIKVKKCGPCISIIHFLSYSLMIFHTPPPSLTLTIKGKILQLFLLNWRLEATGNALSPQCCRPSLRFDF